MYYGEVKRSFSLKQILLPLNLLIALSFLFTVPAADFSDLDFNHTELSRKNKASDFFKLLAEDTDHVVKRSPGKVAYFPIFFQKYSFSELAKEVVTTAITLPAHFLLSGDVKARAPPLYC